MALVSGCVKVFCVAFYKSYGKYNPVCHVLAVPSILGDSRSSALTLRYVHSSFWHCTRSLNVRVATDIALSVIVRRSDSDCFG